MVSQQSPRLSTGLKPGVNETTFGSSPARSRFAAVEELLTLTDSLARL